MGPRWGPPHTRDEPELPENFFFSEERERERERGETLGAVRLTIIAYRNVIFIRPFASLSMRIINDPAGESICRIVVTIVTVKDSIRYSPSSITDL